MNKYGKMILAQNQEYSLDCYETQLNNNVLAIVLPKAAIAVGNASCRLRAVSTASVQITADTRT